MDLIGIKGHFIREKRMEKEDLNGKMDLFMKETLLMVHFLGWVNTTLQSWTKFMKESLE